MLKHTKVALSRFMKSGTIYQLFLVAMALSFLTTNPAISYKPEIMPMFKKIIITPKTTKDQKKLTGIAQDKNLNEKGYEVSHISLQV